MQITKHKKTKAMKNLSVKTLLLAAALMLSCSAARSANNPGKEVMQAHQKIKSSISLPEALKKPGFSKKVKVVFEIGSSQAVEKVSAITPDPVLKASLEAQFRKLKLSELQPGSYHVEIEFNVY
jgi:hypothetical protein